MRMLPRVRFRLARVAMLRGEWGRGRGKSAGAPPARRQRSERNWRHADGGRHAHHAAREPPRRDADTLAEPVLVAVGRLRAPERVSAGSWLRGRLAIRPFVWLLVLL